jgi:hypothetical protein
MRTLPPHQIAQPLDDGKSEPRAAEAPRDRGVGLGKGGEQSCLHIARNADAGIAHDEAKRRVLCGDRDRTNAQLDPAAVRELDRVGQQVGQDLVEARRIAFEGGGQIARCVDLEGDCLGLRVHGHHIGQLLQQAGQLECPVLDDQLARLDLRQVQHVVENQQERLAGELDLREQGRLLVVERRLPQQEGQSDDRVHRRADLVAHVVTLPSPSTRLMPASARWGSVKQFLNGAPINSSRVQPVSASAWLLTSVTMPSGSMVIRASTFDSMSERV